MNNPIGSAGSTEPLLQHHTIEDFNEDYFPHVMCLVGAMCEQCRNNLKENNKNI